MWPNPRRLTTHSTRAEYEYGCPPPPNEITGKRPTARTVMGELGLQYGGISPSDSIMEPYFE